MNYKPRHTTLIVKKLNKEDEITGSGIHIPERVNKNSFDRLEVIEAGPEVKDLIKGNIVLAEKMFQVIDNLNKEIGIIQEQYVWIIENK